MVAVCPAAPQFVGAARQHRPQVIIYSLALDPDLAQLSDVRRATPESAIILWAREFSTELAHQAMELGVRGFLSTTVEPPMMLECIRFAATGEMWMERSLANTLLHWRPVGLSRRQSQLLSLLVQGLKNREIAAELGISEGTVKAYLTTLFEKVGARDRFELRPAIVCGDPCRHHARRKGAYLPLERGDRGLHRRAARGRPRSRHGSWRD